MIDPQTRDLLQAIARRESRSLLSYIGEAFPWVSADGGAALAKLQQIVAEDREATAVLGRFLTRRRMSPPFTGAYPSGFTALNFLALDSLLPRLIAAQRKEIADLERDLATLSDAEAIPEVKKVLAVKRRHLALLEGLAADHPQPAAS